MHNLEKINEAMDNLQKAEESRVLYTVLVRTLGLNPNETTFKEVVETIKHYMNKEKEAIKIMSDMQQVAQEKTEADKPAVS